MLIPFILILLVGCYLVKRYFAKPKVLAIEGIIASGKSTFVDVIKTQLTPYYHKIVIVHEPVDLWVKTNSLQDFYADIKGKAYEFQTFVVVTRIKAVLEAYEKNRDTDLFIIERSPYTDRYIFGEMLYKDGMISEHQMVKYTIWWDLWMKVWPFKITHILHLSPGIDEAQKRCKIRSRDGENIVSLDYQTKLLFQHLDFFKSDKCSYPVLTVDTVEDFRTNTQVQREIENKVKKFLDS